MWAKMLTTAVLLIAGGLTAVCAGWSMAGLSSGMNVNEIMSPVSYEESQKAEHYVRRELQTSWVNSALKLRFCKEMLIMVI